METAVAREITLIEKGLNSPMLDIEQKAELLVRLASLRGEKKEEKSDGGYLDSTGISQELNSKLEDGGGIEIIEWQDNGTATLFPEYNEANQKSEFGNSKSKKNISRVVTLDDHSLKNVLNNIHDGALYVKKAIGDSELPDFVKDLIWKTGFILSDVRHVLKTDNPEKFSEELAKGGEVPEPKTIPLETVTGIFYRADSGFWHDRNTTAKDMIDYMADEEGNEDFIEEAKQTGIDFSKYPARDLIWVTRRKSEAKRYGKEINEIHINDGVIVVKDDGDNGLLILNHYHPANNSENIKELEEGGDVDGSDKAFNLLSKEEWNKLDYDALSAYNGKLWSIANKVRQEFEINNPAPHSRGGLSKNEIKKLPEAQREELRKPYHDWLDKRQRYIDGKTNSFDEVRNKVNEMYRAIPNEQKYKDKIRFLEEAKKSAISELHKSRIQQAIDDMKENGSGGIGYDKYEAYWYTGAKQYATNLVKKLGGKKYHKSGKNVSGSVYYNLPNGDSIRISDHELPSTEERQHNRSVGIGGKWIDVVLDEPRSFDDLKEDVYTKIYEQIGNGDISKHYEKDTKIIRDKIDIALLHREKLESGGGIAPAAHFAEWTDEPSMADRNPGFFIETLPLQIPYPDTYADLWAKHYVTFKDGGILGDSINDFLRLQLNFISAYAEQIASSGLHTELWMKSRIAIAAENIKTLKDYVDTEILQTKFATGGLMIDIAQIKNRILALQDVVDLEDDKDKKEQISDRILALQDLLDLQKEAKSGKGVKVTRSYKPNNLPTGMGLVDVIQIKTDGTNIVIVGRDKTTSDISIKDFFANYKNFLSSSYRTPVTIIEPSTHRETQSSSTINNIVNALEQYARKSGGVAIDSNIHADRSGFANYEVNIINPAAVTTTLPNIKVSDAEYKTAIKRIDDLLPSNPKLIDSWTFHAGGIENFIRDILGKLKVKRRYQDSIIFGLPVMAECEPCRDKIASINEYDDYYKMQVLKSIITNLHNGFFLAGFKDVIISKIFLAKNGFGRMPEISSDIDLYSNANKSVFLFFKKNDMQLFSENMEAGLDIAKKIVGDNVNYLSDASIFFDNFVSEKPILLPETILIKK